MRLYTVHFSGVNVTTQLDWFEVAPATDRPIRVHALFISQTTEIGDAQEEFLRTEVLRGHTTTGSGGGTPTAVPINGRDAAAAFTAKTVNTTQATGGTPVTVHQESWNVRVGLQLVLPPEMRWRCDAALGQRLVVRLGVTPADPITMGGTMYVEEL